MTYEHFKLLYKSKQNSQLLNSFLPKDPDQKLKYTKNFNQ